MATSNVGGHGPNRAPKSDTVVWGGIAALAGMAAVVPSFVLPENAKKHPVTRALRASAGFVALVSTVGAAISEWDTPASTRPQGPRRARLRIGAAESSPAQLGDNITSNSNEPAGVDPAEAATHSAERSTDTAAEEPTTQP